MKKIILVLAIVAIATMCLNGEIKTGKTIPSPPYANNEVIQSGRYIQLYDATATAVTSPVTSATTANQTLIIPDNAVELIINPNGGTLKVESYADTTRYFEFDSIHPFPCNGSDSLRITNDSGSSVTWSFYFNML